MTFLAAAAPLLSTLSTVVGVAGTALSAYSQYQAGKYQQKVAEVNAKVARRNADAAIADSQIKEQTNDQKAAAMMGDQIAAQGASGLSADEGSPLDIRASSAGLARLDTLQIRNNSERTATNFKTQAMSQDANAEMAGMSANNALLGGFINTAGNLLGSARTVSAKWDPWNNNKAAASGSF